ncbi:MAG: DUF262 domain-containing protein [Lachnospiraceae bacterium]|nr:DUF262 domain-containing protein [Lachnospiraceae bacterium]
MNSTLHSFINIFETAFTCGQETVNLQKIIIPIIQRDYAQGRRDPDINRVRDRFLTSLYHAIVDEPITLDFVYGDIDKNGVMTPLDGQQRLTTLFLLHWYAARKANVSEAECAFLSNFGYETRYSARYFCKELTHFVPSFERKLSDDIVDQAWFPLDWQKDPTISSMLVMLDAIDSRFKDVSELWEKLKSGAITFYFLPIRDMGLTDELYIKMNSRGKPLTRFEHFKAELERCIRAVDDAASKRVMRKIDRDWTDMLWQYRDSGNGDPEDTITDDEFLKYFRFICDVLCYQSGGSPQGKSSDEFDLLSAYFTGETGQVRQNIETLESYFDCWCRIDGYSSPADFLKSCMSHTHADGKIMVDSANKIDIFEDCLHSYADKSGKIRHFPLNRIILLYAVTSYLRHRDTITEADYIRRLRCINNLIQNSEDEVSDRIDRNRIPAILQQVDAIMLEGNVNDAIENSFNVNQILEEKEKKAFLEERPDYAPLVFALEDHPNLKGQISIVGLEHVDYADRFVSLFSCKWDLIDCALMSIGDYGQQERNKWRFQYASKGMQIAWDELFHKSANVGFEKTRTILLELLSKAEFFTNESLVQIISEFISVCEESNLYPWRYYYVKYASFRPGCYGKYSNNDMVNNPYLFSVMQTRSQWSSNTYMPYLKEADDPHLSRDSMGQRLVYGDRHIICSNSAYVLRENETEEIIETVPIKQNENGIDIEDRILVLKKYIANMQNIT